MVGVILATVLILILSLIMPVTMPFYLGYGTILLMIVIFLIVGCIGALLSFIKVVKVDPMLLDGIMTLKLEHISKTFGEGLAKTKVLKDINLDVQPGEFIILNGASGSGKSTLLNILGGLLTPTDGKILYEGHDLYSNYKIVQN